MNSQQSIRAARAAFQGLFGALENVQAARTSFILACNVEPAGESEGLDMLEALAELDDSLVSTARFVEKTINALCKHVDSEKEKEFS